MGWLFSNTDVGDDGCFDGITVIVPAERTRQTLADSVLQSRRADIVVRAAAAVPDNEALFSNHRRLCCHRAVWQLTPEHSNQHAVNPFTADPVKAYNMPYWSNPPFLIFDIRALWRSPLSARAPECQKLKMMG